MKIPKCICCSCESEYVLLAAVQSNWLLMTIKTAKYQTYFVSYQRTMTKEIVINTTVNRHMTSTETMIIIVACVSEMEH